MGDTVTISRGDYNRLLNAEQDLRNAGRAASSSVGAPVLTPAELDDYLAASIPLTFWRTRAGKTRAKLAAEVGISPAFLTQIESGKRVGTVGVLAKLARALGVRVDDLIRS